MTTCCYGRPLHVNPFFAGKIDGQNGRRLRNYSRDGTYVQAESERISAASLKHKEVGWLAYSFIKKVRDPILTVHISLGRIYGRNYSSASTYVGVGGICDRREDVYKVLLYLRLEIKKYDSSPQGRQECCQNKRENTRFWEPCMQLGKCLNMCRWYGEK